MRDRLAAAPVVQDDPEEATEAERPSQTRFHTSGPLPPVSTATAQARPSASERGFAQASADQRAQMQRDVVAEHLAHGIAYHDEITSDDQAYLESKGLKVGATLHGRGGLDLTTFVPADGSGATPVLAFRGTKGTDDLVADANPAGVGAFQMAANEGLIATALASLQRYGKPVVTGHSLGGALAQMAAARFPDLVGRVVTFQSPGISRDMVGKLDAYNRKTEQSGGTPVQSQHYSVEGDIVPLAGQAFTSGFITVIASGQHSLLDGLNPFNEHAAYPLEDLVKSGGSPSVHELASADRPSQSRMSRGLQRFAEALRVGVGRAVELGERLGHRGASPTQAYMKLWEDVRTGIDKGQNVEQLVTTIEGSSIREDDKNLMIENLRQITSVRAQASTKRP
ncbi:MAG: DUF2974 domain-containing protein [Kofleriaceae bacterium]|nr:DUF2974 domain-containing protein [Kofleriaceae bacterium]